MGVVVTAEQQQQQRRHCCGDASNQCHSTLTVSTSTGLNAELSMLYIVTTEMLVVLKATAPSVTLVLSLSGSSVELHTVLDMNVFSPSALDFPLVVQVVHPSSGFCFRGPTTRGQHRGGSQSPVWRVRGLCRGAGRQLCLSE